MRRMTVEFCRRRPVFLAVALFVLLACLLTYPQIARLRDSVPEEAEGRPFEDPFLNAWILAWGAHAAPTRPLHLFDTNAFWPRVNTLAYSDHMLGYLPVSIPLFWLSGNAILTHNVILLLTFALSGIGAFLLVREITRSVGPALLAGMVYAFCPLRFEEYHHVQFLSSQWMPFALLCLHRFHARLARGEAFPYRAYAGLLAFGALQSLCSTYHSLFFPLFMGCFAAASCVLCGGQRRAERALWTLLAPLIWTALILPTVLPYARLKSDFGLVRGLDEVVGHSATVGSFFSASSANALYGAFMDWLPPEAVAVFPGLATYGLALVATAALLRRKAWRGQAGEPWPSAWIYLLCFGATALLALGPRIRFAGQDVCWGPYMLLYKWAPGFDGIRAPGRLLMLTMLCLAVLVGVGAHRALGAIGSDKTRRLATALLGGAILVECACVPIALIRVPVGGKIPALYRWLAHAPAPGPVVEVPLDLGLQDKKRMYFSTYHWRKIVNGKSGFLLPEAAAMFLSYAKPGAELVRLMAEMQIDYVVVHDSPAPGLACLYACIPQLKLAKRFGDVWVFRLHREGIRRPASEVDAAKLAETPRTCWRAFAADNPAQIALAQDGDLATAWDTAGDQRRGMRVQIDFDRPRPVRLVRINFGLHADEIPRFLRVSVRRGDGPWGPIMGSEDWPDVFARIYRSALLHPLNPRLDIPINEGLCSQIRFELVERAPAQWAIAELQVYEEPAASGEIKD